MTDKPPPPHIAPEGGEAVPRRKPAAAKKPVTKKAAAKKPAARSKPAAKRKTAATDAAKLVARVSRAIETELTRIETIVGGKRVTPARRTEAERRARTLASLARTLAEMTRLRATQPQAKARDDDDAVPRDLDEFRATLQARLERMVAAEQNAADGGDESG